MNDMAKILEVQTPKCDALHEVTAVVSDYRADPVSKAYQSLFDSEGHRACKKCGNVMPSHRTPTSVWRRTANDQVAKSPGHHNAANLWPY